MFLDVFGSVLSISYFTTGSAAHHCHQPEVTLLFQLCFDDLKASPCGLADCLDEQTLTDPELNPRVIWA